jgi:hypothetical protein
LDELPPSYPILRRPTLWAAAAHFRAGIGLVDYRRMIERLIRLLDENRLVREIVHDLLDARVVRDPGSN